MTAYRESVEFMYADDEALKIFAAFAGVEFAIAKRTRDEFFPKAALDPDSIVGLDTIMNDAVAFKYVSAPLSKDQLSQLLRPPAK
jgi:NitT/TauT family transport system substrate-binding protein